MAGEDILTYTGQAAIAYQDALNQARNSQNMLLRQYGLTGTDASGNYTVEGAQAAFDPNTLIKDTNTGLDINKVTELAKGLRVGATGKLADIMSGGVSGEADVVGQARAAGFGEASGIGGGIINQRRQLAESKAQQDLAAGKQEFLTAEANALAPIGEASSAFKQAQFKDVAATREANAQSSIWDRFLNTPFAEAQNNAGSVASNTPGPKQYQRRTINGVKQQYINGNWKKV
jgi:hypothetical protein